MKSYFFDSSFSKSVIRFKSPASHIAFIDFAFSKAYFLATMKIEDFENATDAELRQKLIETFEEAESIDHLAGTILLRKARFFQDEIERRKNDKISRRDFRMELGVMALIGLEIILAVVLAIWGAKQQTRDVNQELVTFGQIKDVLSHLQDTSKTTADTLSTLETTTETMNAAVQNQLALLYDVSVITSFDVGTKRLGVMNTGRTSITLFGNKFWDSPALIQPNEPRLVAPGTTYSIDGVGVYNEMAQRIRKGGGQFVPWVIYLRNEAGKKIVVRTYLAAQWENDALAVRTQILSIRQEEWSNK